MCDDDSSGNVTAAGGEREAADTAPSETTVASLTADGALRLAITLAVEAGDYERASALLEVLKHSPMSRLR